MPDSELHNSNSSWNSEGKFRLLLLSDWLDFTAKQTNKRLRATKEEHLRLNSIITRVVAAAKVGLLFTFPVRANPQCLFVCKCPSGKVVKQPNKQPVFFTCWLRSRFFLSHASSSSAEAAATSCSSSPISLLQVNSQQISHTKERPTVIFIIESEE